MDSNDKNIAEEEIRQSLHALEKAVKEKSPDAHLLATKSLAQNMVRFITSQGEHNKEIFDLIKTFILAQKENNRKTAGALVKIVVVLLAIIFVLLIIIFREQLIGYLANGIDLYSKISPDQKFNLIYVIPATAIITWFISRRKSKG